MNKQVLIINITRMGDLIQMIPLLARLEEEWPGVGIDLIVDREFAHVASLIPGIRQVLVFEDAAGFIVRGVLMKRDEGDKQVAVRETKALQEEFQQGVKRLSFDRGFHSPDNQTELSELVDHLCLPKPGAKQSVVQLSEADDEFLVAQQNHPGIESAIGALQSGNALKRCRDRSEIGFERYLQLAILGRNLHTLGRLLIAKMNQDAAAGQSRRKAA